MCGICGFAGFKDNALLGRMCDSIMHRGPDSGGFFEDENISLGIRRLRIIDLASGDQPIHNEDSTIWLVFNGEIYNFRKLRESLEQKGHKFYTNTDTEVIVHSYEEYGRDCLQYLEGMFAFALWDGGKKELFLARDPLGIKPLYYCLQNGRLFFASEMKALLSSAEVKKEIDFRALDYFLNFLYVPAPYSIFKDIRKLSAGHILVYKAGGHKIKQYWDVSINRSAFRTQDSCKEELYSILKNTVKAHLASDVPVGLFLSGGMDSSAIAAFMAQAGSAPVKTFSIGYDKKSEQSYNELEYARSVAEFYGTQHYEFIITPDLIKTLPQIVRSFDEPFADSSSLLTFFLSREARRHITVALTGIGGDECFGGYPRHMGMKLYGWYSRLPNVLKNALAGFSGSLPEFGKSRDFSNWAKRFTKGALHNPSECYLSWVSFLSAESRKALYSKNLLNRLDDAGFVSMHEDFWNKAGLGSDLDRMFYLDVKTYLADDLLAMADRMSMASSLELRVPFCDTKLLQFAFSIPPELKLKGMTLKYLFKETLRKTVPPDVITRRKQGFMVPMPGWLNNELKPFALEMLSESNIKKRGYFNYPAVKELLDQHCGGKRNNSDLIWALIILEQWHQTYET